MTSTLLYEISLLNQIKNFSPIDLNLNQYEIGFVEKYCKCMISKFCRKLQSWNFPQNKTIHFNFSFLAFVCPTHDIVYLIKSKKEKSLFFALLKSCQLSVIFCVSASRVKFDLEVAAARKWSGIVNNDDEIQSRFAIPTNFREAQFLPL